jgi:adenylate cyclase
VRIGIDSGEALTGTIGDRYSRHYTACGFPVALAKRIETLAAPGGIYLSEQTAALIAEELQVRDLGAFMVKGAISPVATSDRARRRGAGGSVTRERDAIERARATR